MSSAIAKEPPPQSRPNILWLTMEDTSSYEFGCYGNKQVHTPNIDALALKGALFTKASSTAPQCSPARSTIISGSFATTYGTDFHRQHYLSPKERPFLPLLMKQAGYLCLNVRKTDYNTSSPIRLWDKGADYSQASKPFFAIFNNTKSHMTAVRSATLNASEIDISHLEHLPNIPEIRANYAKHLAAVETVDQWVGKKLDQLKASGKEDDTIVFFYSDHGGCQPRGKAYAYETGLRVPLIVYVPPKWQHLCPDLAMGKKTDRLVGFEDLAPTVLSLAGLRPPSQMQGKAFMGKYAKPPKTYQFGFRTNQGIHFDPVRTVTDGRYKYIKNYIPHKPLGMRQAYQWGMGANLAYDHAYLKGDLSPEYAAFFKAKPVEMLFDLQEDPYEMKNLAGVPAHRERLKTLREQVAAQIREAGDLGFFPPTTRDKDETSLYDWVRTNDFPLEELYTVVEMASEGKVENAPMLTKHLMSDHASIRFWAASGFTTIGSLGHKLDLPESLEALSHDSNSDVAAAAAETLCYHGQEEQGVKTLVALIQRKNPSACSALEAFVKNRGVTGAIKPHIPVLKKMAAEKGPVGYKQPLFYIRSILVECGINTPWDLYEHDAWALEK